MQLSKSVPVFAAAFLAAANTASFGAEYTINCHTQKCDKQFNDTPEPSTVKAYCFKSGADRKVEKLKCSTPAVLVTCKKIDNDSECTCSGSGGYVYKFTLKATVTCPSG